MKKIAAIFTFLLAFTISASAQESKLTPEEAAKKDVMELHQFVELTDIQQQNLVALFKQKHKVLSNPSTSEERKKEMPGIIAAKINASMNEEQLERLSTNSALLEKLIR